MGTPKIRMEYGLSAVFNRKPAISLKRGKTAPKLLLMTNIGFCIRAFDWCQNQRPWMTLKCHYALCFQIHAFSEPITKTWMKVDPHYQQRRCSAMTLVSGNIRFMRIFARVPWRGGIKRLGLSKTAIFSTFAHFFSSEALELRPTLLHSIIYFLVAFQLTPKYVTLIDHEWPCYVKLFLVKFKFKIYLCTYTGSAMLSMVKVACLQRALSACMYTGSFYKAIKYSKT